MQTPVRLLVCNRLRNIVRLLINLPIVIIVLKESEVLAPLIFGGIFHFNAIISVLEIYLFYCSLDFTIILTLISVMIIRMIFVIADARI